MATVRKLKVSTPQTADGKTLKYDKNQQVIYSESFVEPGSKAEFERLNAKLPEHLRHKLEIVDVEETKVTVMGGKPVAENAGEHLTAIVNLAQSELGKRDETIAGKDQLIADKDQALSDKDKEIEALKKQLAAKPVAPEETGKDKAEEKGKDKAGK